MSKKELNVTKILLPHILILVGSCVALQIFIAVRGSEIDVAAYLGLSFVALYYAYFHSFSQKGKDLKRIRFGRLVAHLCGFLIVNLSFHIHAYMLYVSNNPVMASTDGLLMNEQWFGVIYGMMSFWGIGLLIHLIASVGARGYEELHY
jgi:membrane protein CcdC involved in cytochrome C biogenesis